MLARWFIGVGLALVVVLGVGVLPASASIPDPTTTAAATTTTLAETTTLYPPWTSEDQRSHATNMELGIALLVFLVASLTVMRFRS